MLLLHEARSGKEYIITGKSADGKIAYLTAGYSEDINNPVYYFSRVPNKASVSIVGCFGKDALKDKVRELYHGNQIDFGTKGCVVLPDTVRVTERRVIETDDNDAFLLYDKEE